jgi:hypothetical protein
MCPSERLAGAAEDAMRVLRIAAPPPQVVAGITDDDAGCTNSAVATCTIEDLLITGWGASVPTGAGCSSNVDSVRCRLAVITRDPTVAVLDSVDALAAHYGLTRADFVSARSRMAEELSAFNRSFDSLMPGAPLDHDQNSTDYFSRYAATGTEPGPTLASFYSTVAGYVVTPNVATIDVTLGVPKAPTPSPYGYDPLVSGEDRADAADGALSGLRRLVSILHGTTSSPAIRAALDLVGTEAGTRGPTVQARLSTCWIVPPDSSVNYGQVHVRLYSDETIATDTLRIVAGRDGLECAVTGAIDGAPCSAAQLDTLTPSLDAAWASGTYLGVDEPVPTDLANAYYAVFEAGSFDLMHGRGAPNPQALLFFVVRRRAGATVAPGGYEARRMRS